jgi:hypothetical protein
MSKRKQQDSFGALVPYQTKANLLPGTAASEVFPHARAFFRSIEKKTKRKAYIRSVYFRKDKIFLTHFWRHLFQKSRVEQVRRLKYLLCAIELLRHSRNEPSSRESTEEAGIILHRFAGLTKTKELFYVQIKECKRTNKKEFMSVFPHKKNPPQ